MKCKKCREPPEGKIKAISVSTYGDFDDTIDFTVFFKCEKCNAKYHVVVKKNRYNIVED